MALKVWLPLNGSLENKGISDITVTNNGATVNNNGKIGKCYSFDGTADKIYTTNFLINNEWSYGCWFYSATSERGWEAIIILNNNGGDSDIQFGLYIKPSSKSLQTTANGQYSIISYVPDQWNHFLATFDGSILTTYINGVEVNTKTITNSLLTRANLTIGARSTSTNGAGTSASNFFQGRINDVRIYDHCLSPLEVKEISQGLVLHYKLNGFCGGVNGNILNNTSFKDQYIQSTGWDTTKNGTQLARSWGGYNGGVSNQATVYHAHLKQFNNDWVYEYIKTSNETWLGISQSGLQTKIVAGETYTFSWEQYCVDGVNYTGTGLYYYKTGATYAEFHLGLIYGNTNRVMGQWQKFSRTFIAPTDGDYSKNMSWYIYGHYGGNGTFYVRHPKLEKGSIATSWTPALSEMGIDTSKITDSSGYGNDGIINGNLITDNNTSKYSSSTFFDGNTAAIKIPFNDIIKDKNYTVSCWTYKTTIGTKNYQTILGGPSGFELEARSSSNTSPLYRIYNWGGGTTPYEFNKWNHFCFVHTDADSKLYVNGELKITGTSANIPTGNYFIGSWSTATSQNYEGQMSDFRIYATALSAEDILDLYHTSANIDNLGGVHGFEFEEKQGNMLAVSPLDGSLTWDSENNYYVITSQPSTSFWGVGPFVGVTPKKIIPWGYSYRLSYEVYSPTAATWYVDYNNNTIDVTLSGNDNDTGRIATGISVPANQWTLITLGCSNTNETKNPNHLPLYDYSSGLGPVMTNISSPITWYMRNPQWYLVDTDESTNFQIYENGIFKTNFLKEDNLNDFASFRNNEKATWGVNFIEK